MVGRNGCVLCYRGLNATLPGPTVLAPGSLDQQKLLRVHPAASLQAIEIQPGSKASPVKKHLVQTPGSAVSSNSLCTSCPRRLYTLSDAGPRVPTEKRISVRG